MASVRILGLFSVALVICLGMALAEFENSDEENADAARSFREWMKRGCDSAGSKCSKESCCAGSFCNPQSGACDRCSARGKGCGYFKPCCPGSHCLYKGRISICT